MMKKYLEQKLKSARAMYITHKRHNHGDYRLQCIEFWGDQCRKLKQELVSL